MPFRFACENRYRLREGGNLRQFFAFEKTSLGRLFRSGAIRIRHRVFRCEMPGRHEPWPQWTGQILSQRCHALAVRARNCNHRFAALPGSVDMSSIRPFMYILPRKLRERFCDILSLKTRKVGCTPNRLKNRPRHPSHRPKTKPPAAYQRTGRAALRRAPCTPKERSRPKGG